MEAVTETVNVRLKQEPFNEKEEISTYARIQLVGCKEAVELVKQLILKNEGN